MIDPTVAYDKIAQFETSQEVAEFLGECGVKGTKASAFSCAISVYMSIMTGRHYSTAGTIEEWDDTKGAIKEFFITDALCEFITKFDHGEYSELVIDS